MSLCRVIRLNVITPSGIILSGIMQRVIFSSAIRLNVVAPCLSAHPTISVNYVCVKCSYAN
jgi:hypothetical protein